MTNPKLLFPLFLLFAYCACKKGSTEKPVDYGSAVIRNAKQEIKARNYYYFTCKKRTEEHPFGSFAELRVDDKEFRIVNIENNFFEGRIIGFEIDKSLKIFDVQYDEYYDVIDERKTEKYDVIESGINLSINPFNRKEGQEIIGDYFLKIRHTTDYEWSWKEEVDIFTIAGRFKCDKNMW